MTYNNLLNRAKKLQQQIRPIERVLILEEGQQATPEERELHTILYDDIKAD